MRASMEPNRRGEMIDGVGRSDGGGRGYTGSAMEVTTFNQSFGDAHAAASADFPVWDKIGAVVRLSYGIGNHFFSFLFFFVFLENYLFSFFGVIVI